MLIPNHEVYGHFNDYKDKFNNLIHKSCKLYREMMGIDMDKRTWSKRDLSYFCEGSINHVGLTTYWQSMCNAFKSWDKDQMKTNLFFNKREEHTQVPNIGQTKNQNRSKFHRERDHPKNTWKKDTLQQFRLPKPKNRT